MYIILMRAYGCLTEPRALQRRKSLSCAPPALRGGGPFRTGGPGAAATA